MLQGQKYVLLLWYCPTWVDTGPPEAGSVLVLLHSQGVWAVAERKQKLESKAPATWAARWKTSVVILRISSRSGGDGNFGCSAAFGLQNHPDRST